MTLKEYDLQKLVCAKCHHIEFGDANHIKSLANENYHCPVCWTDGVHRNNHFVVCSSCHQVWNSRQVFLHIKGCEVVKPNLFKIEYDPHGKWMKDKQLEKKTIDTQISVAKSEKIYKERIAKERNKPVEKQIVIEELLKENNKIQTEIRDILSKKEPEVKAKEINHGAIG